MRKTIESRIKKSKGYIFQFEEFDEHGLFLRNPIQEVFHDRDYWDYDKQPTYSMCDFVERCNKNPIYRTLQIILGNGEHVKNTEYMDEFDYAGSILKTLVSPIYFKRRGRELKAIAIDKNNEIQKIHSKGFEGYACQCAGECKTEKTIVLTRVGKKTFNYKDSFHYTYQHICEKELLD